MTDLFERIADEVPDNVPEYTVGEISGAVRRLIEDGFPRVRVRGEIGRVSRPRSGHVYLDLKDDRNVLAGVIWRSDAARIVTQPEEGLEVVAEGRLTSYGGQSKYQLAIERIEPAGIGALMAMLEKRKKALEAEGLFDQARKKPLPYLPEVIGVVTSPSGAVIRDILHRLRERFPREVLIWPAAVQGENCAEEVARGIAGFNRLDSGGGLPRPDLLIVARGGGSLEDLWGFNEEIVARAAAASEIPLISAVGHETDTTLIDHAADCRAPTPTAAAELAVPVRLDLLAQVESHGARLSRAVANATGLRRQRLVDLSRALPRPSALAAQAEQRLDIWAERLPKALIASARGQRARLVAAASALRPATLSRALRERARILADRSGRLSMIGARSTTVGGQELSLVSRRLAAASPARGLARMEEACDRLAERLSAAWVARIGERAKRLDALERLRQSLGYAETLRRGFAVVRGDGRVVATRAAAGRAGALEIEFSDGRLDLGSAKPEREPAKGPGRKPCR